METHNGIGFTYFQAGHINESISSYERALAIKPNNLDALLGLALGLSEDGQNQKAAELIQKVKTISITIGSETINKIILQGNILVEEGEYQSAIIFYDRVLKLYDNVNTINDKAIALMELGEYDEALIMLDNTW